MPFRDLREFIGRLEAEGEAKRIEEEVDWNLEVGAMVRRASEQGLPAPFFQKIKDYGKEYRILGGMLANYRRLAMAMDLAPDTSRMQLMEVLLERSKKPIKPVIVSNGPCKENIYTGDEVDVLKFPVPLVHYGDRERYIGTFHLTITKDPDSDWVNWGMYRHAVHNRNNLGIYCENYKHLGVIYCKSHEPTNVPMEIAIAIGVEPISSLCAASALPDRVTEADVAGGLRCEPVQLIKCETVDLFVPATAEIVLEGEIRPEERTDEGPFGEFTGYMASVRQPRKVIHVKAITHRDNPILSMVSPGIPVDDCVVSQSITRGAQILQALRAAGIQVRGVNVTPEGAVLLAVVAVKANYSNIADHVANIFWGTKAGLSTPYIIIVDDDVDPFNMTEVIHALATKCHPWRGIQRSDHAAGHALHPFLNAHERKHSLGARAYFDCTWPLDWDPADVPERSAFSIYPPEIQEKVLAKWQKLGY